MALPWAGRNQCHSSLSNCWGKGPSGGADAFPFRGRYTECKVTCLKLPLGKKERRGPYEECTSPSLLMHAARVPGTAVLSTTPHSPVASSQLLSPSRATQAIGPCRMRQQCSPPHMSAAHQRSMYRFQGCEVGLVFRLWVCLFQEVGAGKSLGCTAKEEP